MLPPTKLSLNRISKIFLIFKTGFSCTKHDNKIHEIYNFEIYFNDLKFQEPKNCN